MYSNFVLYICTNKRYKIMKNTIKQELANYIIDLINDEVLTNDNKEDWHFHAFNEGYYVTYRFAAIDWLKEHNLDVFEVIEIVKEYEQGHFGEMTTSINPESIVNMLAYIYGEQLIYSEDFDTVEELKESMKELL